MKTWLLLILFSLSKITIGQVSQHKSPFTLADSSNLSTLQKQYGYNKEIPRQYQFPVLLALSYFPELDSSRIVFKEAKIKTTLNARPTVGSLLFKNRTKRKYVVRINTTKRDSAVLLQDVPLNAMVGLFGHEFCHFIDYNQKGLFGVIGRLLNYTSKKAKEEFEKEIDQMTIERGLGWQLYDWSFYVLNYSNASTDYRAYKGLFYLEPEEIIELIHRN